MKCINCNQDIPNQRIKASFRCRSCNAWYKTNIEFATGIAIVTGVAVYVIFRLTRPRFYLDQSEYVQLFWLYSFPVALILSLFIFLIVLKIRLVGNENRERKIGISDLSGKEKTTVYYLIAALIGIPILIAIIFHSINYILDNFNYLDQFFNPVDTKLVVWSVILISLMVIDIWRGIRNSSKEYHHFSNYIIYCIEYSAVVIAIAVVSIAVFFLYLFAIDAFP